MKGIELRNLLIELNRVSNLETNFKFAYAVSKNKKILLPVLKQKEKEYPISPEILNMNKELNELNAKFEGEELSTKADELFNKYKDAIKAQEEIEAKFNKVEIDVELYKIKVEFMPDGLTANQIDNLTPIIEDL